MEQKDKDIMNMFAGTKSMKMDPDKKRQIKMSIISDTPAPVFSWWMVMKMTSVSAVVVLVVIAGFTWNENTAVAPIALEPILNTEGLPVDGNSQTSNSAMSDSMPMGMGGGNAESASPATFAKTSLMVAPEPEKRGVKMLDGVEYSVIGFVDGYDKNSNPTVTIVAKNIDEVPKHLQFNNGCQTYIIIDGFDSRSTQSCIQAIIDIYLGSFDEYVWEVKLPFKDLGASFGTHKVTVGLEGYYEFTQEVVLEG